MVLLDIRLPFLDGYSVARHMKKLRPEITIIAHSAYARNKERLKAEDAGFDGYLTKPALPNNILELVNAHLNQKKK